MMSEGLIVGDLDFLKNTGQMQIETINKIKKELSKIFAVAIQIYIKACKALNVQPSPSHFSARFNDIPSIPKSYY
jgi:hypothetical protein